MSHLNESFAGRSYLAGVDSHFSEDAMEFLDLNCLSNGLGCGELVLDTLSCFLDLS